jgi:hypothetical protein
MATMMISLLAKKIKTAAIERLVDWFPCEIPSEKSNALPIGLLRG